MSLNQVEIERAVAELRGPLVGSKVRAVRQPRPRTVLLELFGTGGASVLLLSVDPSAVRLHLTTRRLDNPPAPPAFCMLLRKELVGRRIEGVFQEEGDRVVTLIFSGRGDDSGMVSLVCELTGRSANLFLVDGDDAILGVLDPRMAARRELAVGSLFVPRSKPDGRRTFEAREFNETAGTYSERLDAYYSGAGETQALDAEKKHILKAIRRATKRLTKYIKAGEADRGRLSDFETLRHHAELIKANLHGLPRRADRVTVSDYDGAEVSVDLDPKRSVTANADHLFKQARKHERGLLRLETQDARNRERLAALETLAEKVEAAGDFDALVGLAGDLGNAGIAPPGDGTAGAQAPPRKKTVQQPAGPHRFETEDGLTVLVGRNDGENDRLSTRIASGNDYFFHVRGYAGSHVVVRLPRGGELTQAAVLDAAHLALFYSKLKGQASGEVSYTRCKYVRKPKGYPPGKVTITGEKTIRLRVDPKRLDRVLATRNSDTGGV